MKRPGKNHTEVDRIADPSLCFTIQRILRFSDLGSALSTLGRAVSARAPRHCSTHMPRVSKTRSRWLPLQPSTPAKVPSCAHVPLLCLAPGTASGITSSSLDITTSEAHRNDSWAISPLHTNRCKLLYVNHSSICS